MCPPTESPARGEVPDLRSVQVRLLRTGERRLWDRLMREHHYLGFRSFVGESLRYVAEWQGRWVALLGWCSAALKCQARDRFIGWPEVLKWQRLGLVVNNARFLILPGERVVNLASRVLSLNLKRLSGDWELAYGHPVFLAETLWIHGAFLGPATGRRGGWKLGRREAMGGGLAATSSMESRKLFGCGRWCGRRHSGCVPWEESR